MKLLLISNSTNPGEPYLGWPQSFISDFTKRHQVKNVLFVPYAGVNLSPDSIEESYNLYEKKVADVFNSLGLKLKSIHTETDQVKAVENADCIAVGGGNTFHLVAMMHTTGIMHAIRQKALSGSPFMGWSAGANVACPTLRTTNDMPIIQPLSFDCLNLVPFQINPHYLDANPTGHGGETRQQRIEEFLAINRSINVLGLRESSLLDIDGISMMLKGNRGMRLFRFGHEPLEFEPESDLSSLLR
ncbi:MAG: dipeptidase PepE [Bacteroidales bacterium]|nr:dipeptidase PepE [Bacteroidales bacterium]